MTETPEQVNAAMADTRFIKLGALSDSAWTATLDAWRTTGQQIGKSGMPYANAEWGQPMTIWRTSGPGGAHPLSIGIQEREAAQKIAEAWTRSAAAWDALTIAMDTAVARMDDEDWARQDFVSEAEICREHPDAPRCKARQI